MANDKVTSLQVAKRAGVSQSAVSRVFTPGASASKKTADKVRKAAKELGYRPNVLARSLITGKSRIIGMVVAYLDNYFYPAAIEKLSVALQEKGYHVLVFMAAPTVGDVEEVMHEILDYQVDGMILASVSLSSMLAAKCEELGVPVLLFNRDQDDQRLSSVTTDNFTGGRAVAGHLLDCGYRKLGYIAGFEGASTQRDREQGFRAGLAQAGLEIHARGVGNFSHEESRHATRKMFDRPDRPDAVFVCNDHMAFAVMDTLRSELGLRIPQDAGVAGFDDVPIAAWPAYDLTTYSQPLDRMVTETVATLIDRIESGNPDPRRLRLEGRLVVRKSTRPTGVST
jgi:DNA-binding LacI/PurR family transcriptional regulator